MLGIIEDAFEDGDEIAAATPRVEVAVVDAAVYVHDFGYLNLPVFDDWLLVNCIDCH